MSAMLNELEDVLIALVHKQNNYVAVIPHGSEGCKPLVEAQDCGLVREDASSLGYVSCVSGSGDSLCGYYRGHVGNNVIQCGHERKK
jgi:hypothetical protein